jgi:zinc transport system ATP-binding protein
MSIISLSNVTVGYGTHIILEDMSFEISPGDYVGLAGPNGAGKSTLVRAILGLIPTQKGDIRLFDTPLSQFRLWDAIGYLAQRPPETLLRFPGTVREVVTLGLIARKSWPKLITDQDKKLVDQMLQTLDISHLANLPLNQLSGGQQQRALLARALVLKPQLLILDEPTNALDPNIRRDFFQVIQNLNLQEKVTIILISHDTSSIGEYANKLMYIDREIVFYGTFPEFCMQDDMNRIFGTHSHHQICHQDCSHLSPR